MEASVQSRSKSAVTTPYIILSRIPEQTGAGWSELADVSGEATFVVESRGAEQAIRDALRLSATLLDMAKSGDGVEILPIPKRSYQPKPVRLVVQDPVIKIG